MIQSQHLQPPYLGFLNCAPEASEAFDRLTVDPPNARISSRFLSISLATRMKSSSTPEFSFALVDCSIGRSCFRLNSSPSSRLTSYCANRSLLLAASAMIVCGGEYYLRSSSQRSAASKESALEISYTHTAAAASR